MERVLVRRALALLVLPLLLLTTWARGGPIINVGDHALAPNTPGQIVVIPVSGGDAVQGINLLVQVADGGPPLGGTLNSGPKITDISITTGTMQIVSAIAFRRAIHGEFWMALGGVISIVFGVLLVASPGSGLVSLVWLVGIWALASGGSSLAFSIRLFQLNRELRPAARAA